MKTVYLYGSEAVYGNYITALHAAGLRVLCTQKLADSVQADALLLPGGGDIAPACYGQPCTSAHSIDRRRDAAEMALLRTFLRDERPVLGICRGLQLINVALGGTLYQHIDGHGQNTDGTDSTHETTAQDWLRTLYGERFVVNSAHHQAIDRMGSGLLAMQRAADGTVEAIRHTHLPVYGLQWHPERMCGGWRRDGWIDGAALFAWFAEQVEKMKK